MIKRGLILIVAVVVMLGGTMLLEVSGYGESPVRFVCYAFIGGLTGAVYTKLTRQRRR